MRFTILDALSAEIKVKLIAKVCRDVNSRHGDVSALLGEMTQAGCWMRAWGVSLMARFSRLKFKDVKIGVVEKAGIR